MTQFFVAFLSWCGAFFRSRHDLGLELAALRQQLGVLKRQSPRPQLSRWNRLFWLALRRLWPKWASTLVIVKPETVVSWHRAGFRWHWRLLSRHRPGRPKISLELRKLIRSMAAENPTWGAPRIHGELLKLGFEISECTVSRYLAQIDRGRDSGKGWLVFLKNHREAIAAMDFFTVPTVTFRVLYCFFVISHGRRRILHFNATEHPTAQWLVQQLREAFPEDRAPKYLVLDRDGKFNGEVAAMLKCLGSKLIRTAYHSPWQNGVAERWVGSCRRELLDHVIVLSEPHLPRLVREYIRYYQEDRVHDALDKDTPTGRVLERRQTEAARVVGVPRVGGLSPSLPVARGRLKRTHVQAAAPSVAASFSGSKPRPVRTPSILPKIRLRVRPCRVDKGGRELAETTPFSQRSICEDRQVGAWVA
jgi:putative transposase